MDTSKRISLIDSQLLVDYILKKYGPMSHLKLQKLLYYCEAYHLAYFDDSLINDEFEAWIHGPVSRKIYNELKDKSILYTDLSFNNSYNTEKALKEKLTIDQFQLINDVLEELSSWTGFELENATHSELPWIEARNGYSPADRCENIISKTTMKTFYQNELNAN